MLKKAVTLFLILIPILLKAQENKSITDVKNTILSFDSAISNNQADQIEKLLNSKDKEITFSVAQLYVKQNHLIKLASQGIEMYGKDEFSKCHKNAAFYLGLLTYKPDYKAIASDSEIKVKQDSAFVNYTDPLFNRPKKIILVKSGKEWVFNVDENSLAILPLLRINEGINEYISFMEKLLSKNLAYQDFCKELSPAIDQIYPKLKLY